MAGLITITLRAVGGKVLVIANGEPVAWLAWQSAKEQAVELKRKASSSAEAQIGYVLATEGRPIGLDVERSAALQIASALHQAGALAEEQADPAAHVEDAALLIRMGAPLALSSDPRVQEEAWKEAQWGTTARRTPLRGIPSRSQVGTPVLLMTPPKRKLQ